MRHAARLLRTDDEAGSGRQVRPEPAREPDPGGYREVRDVRARHLCHRRHQLVSRQAEADPVRLPRGGADGPGSLPLRQTRRSEEHTSELQSLMRISYAVFCLKKKKNMRMKYIK